MNALPVEVYRTRAGLRLTEKMPVSSLGDLPLVQHDVEVLRKRAIATEIARERGYESIDGAEAVNRGFPSLAGMLIPSYNTVGLVERYQLRPHIPQVGSRTKKPNKYLWPRGSRQSIDVPPRSRSTLSDVDVPLIITESPLKADSILSALADMGGQDRYCVVAVAGVYGWRSGGMPLSDHSDIPWRRQVRGRIRKRRNVFIAFDSDASTNPKVQLARWSYAEYLRRLGAEVCYLEVPPAPDGAKQGIDDALAAGTDLTALLDAAEPAPRVGPTPDTSNDDELSEVERLRNKILRLERERRFAILAGKNPYVTDSVRKLVICAATLVMAKASHGNVEPDGRVRLSPAELSQDFRPKPEPGQPRMKTNPDGSAYRLTRSSVRKVASDARNLGLIEFEFVLVRKARGNGRPYDDYDLLFTPPNSIADFLEPLANYKPSSPIIRKDYRGPVLCPSCGETHARTVKTVCGTSLDPGCGTVTEERVMGSTPPRVFADGLSLINQEPADGP